MFVNVEYKIVKPIADGKLTYVFKNGIISAPNNNKYDNNHSIFDGVNYVPEFGAVTTNTSLVSLRMV